MSIAAAVGKRCSSVCQLLRLGRRGSAAFFGGYPKSVLNSHPRRSISCYVGPYYGLLTVTNSGADTPWFPTASRATALSVWQPLDTVVVFHAIDYGAAVYSAPRFAPSNLKQRYHVAFLALHRPAYCLTAS